MKYRVTLTVNVEAESATDALDEAFKRIGLQREADDINVNKEYQPVGVNGPAL